MSHWLRPRLACAALLCSLLCPALASAQTPRDRAEELNAEGKKLFKDQDYEEAAKKFKQAIVFFPDARYYFNLCFALNILERYKEALEQCRLVEQHNPPPDLQQKSADLLVELEK